MKQLMNDRIMAAARSQQGVRNFDNTGRNFDNMRGFDQQALGFDVVATAGLSTFTYVLDNSLGLGIDINMPMFNAYSPIWVVNDGSYIANTGAYQIDAKITDPNGVPDGGVYFYLHSDATKYARLYCEELNYVASVNSAFLRPFLVKTILYQYNSTIPAQSAKQLQFYQGQNLFGSYKYNQKSPIQSIPGVLQTAGILNISFANAANASDYRVDAETTIAHTVVTGSKVTMVWGVSEINTGNLEVR